VGTAATVRWATAATAARALSDGSGTLVSAGCFHATLPMQALGLYPEGVVRASILHYNSTDDVRRLLAAVAALAASAASPRATCDESPGGRP
jgi:selenocysteine lyase/cysteine desulfurase